MMIQIENALAQQIVDTVKSVCGHDINFINTSGFIIASTDPERIGTYHEIGHQVAKTRHAISVSERGNFTGTRQGLNLPIINEHSLLAVIGISGDPQKVEKYAALATRVTLLLVRERELMYLSHTQSDKRKFVLDTLLENPKEPPELLYPLLEELKLDLNASCRLVFLRVCEGNPSLSGLAVPVVEELFENLHISLRSYRYPNEHLGVLAAGQYAQAIPLFKRFLQDHGNRFQIAIGQEVSLAHISVSYETAQSAWKSIAGENIPFALFDDMPLKLMLSFIKPDMRKTFENRILQNLTPKDRRVLRCYFDVNMSLAEASEKLFIHKNTLQYQLNHIFEQCGRNPRRFQDAVQLYLALQMEEIR